MELISVLALAALPALGNLAGSLLAEFAPVSRRTLSLALHGAAGIVLAVVGVELMPTALQASVPWVVILAFVAGGGFFILMDQGVDLVRARMGGDATSRAWMVYLAVAADLLSDGIMIGTSSTIDLGLALLLALGQVSADVPEGFATLALFRSQGVPRGRRLWLALSLAVPVLVGALLSYGLLRGRPDLMKLSLLGFTAGILVTLVVEEIVPEAHQDEEARLAALVLVGGFALFTWLSVYLG